MKTKNKYDKIKLVNGTAYGMFINDNGVDTYYYYLFNLQGDIVGIMDSSGNTVTV